MAQIARLNIDIVANIAKLVKGFKKAGGVVQRFRGRLNNFGKSLMNLKTAFAALAVALGARRIVRSLQQTAAAIDAIGKKSRQLGFATEELIALQHAARLTAGIGAREFQMAMQRMTRRLAEAAIGTGEARESIKKLGIDAKKLAKAGPAEAFKLFAEAAKDAGNEGEITRIAFKLFDSEAAQLALTLMQGQEGLERYAKDAEELGILLTDADIQQIEKMNDAWFRVGQAIEGIKNKILIPLAPVMKALADHITATFVALQKHLGDSNALMIEMTAWVGALVNAFEMLTAQVQLFAGGLKQLASELKQTYPDPAVRARMAAEAQASVQDALKRIAKAAGGGFAAQFAKSVMEALADIKKRLGGEGEESLVGGLGGPAAPPAVTVGDPRLQSILRQTGTTNIKKDMKRVADSSVKSHKELTAIKRTLERIEGKRGPKVAPIGAGA